MAAKPSVRSDGRTRFGLPGPSVPDQTSYKPLQGHVRTKRVWGHVLTSDGLDGVDLGPLTRFGWYPPTVLADQTTVRVELKPIDHNKISLSAGHIASK